MSVILREQRLQQAQVNFSLMFLHIHGGKIKSISNMQIFWHKCGVVEAVDAVLNLPVRLNPVIRDSISLLSRCPS
jgi:hypothetical protein